MESLDLQTLPDANFVPVAQVCLPFDWISERAAVVSDKDELGEYSMLGFTLPSGNPFLLVHYHHMPLDDVMLLVPMELGTASAFIPLMREIATEMAFSPGVFRWREGGEAASFEDGHSVAA